MKRHKLVLVKLGLSFFLIIQINSCRSVSREAGHRLQNVSSETQRGSQCSAKLIQENGSAIRLYLQASEALIPNNQVPEGTPYLDAGDKAVIEQVSPDGTATKVYWVDKPHIRGWTYSYFLENCQAAAPTPTVDRCTQISQTNGQVGPFPTINLSNGILTLMFMKEQYGARLYRIIHKDHGDILYQNYEGSDRNQPKYPRQQNWGRQGFTILGGVETAFPNQEHGEIGEGNWSDQRLICDQALGTLKHESISMPDSFGNRVKIETYLFPGEASFYQRVSPYSIAQEAGHVPWMYYSNFMLDSGSGANRDDLQVLFPGQQVSDADMVVHSREGNDSGSIHNNQDVSGSYLHDSGRRNLQRHQWEHPNIHINPGNWLGYFYVQPVKRATIYNQTRHFGLNLQMLDGNAFVKVFCGHELTRSASGSDKAYCEWWYSPNAPTFWHWPTQAASIQHHVRFDVISALP